MWFSCVLYRLRDHPRVDRRAPLIPIVECNNNEIFAMTIVACFRQFGPIYIPYTKDNFRSSIVEGIGVITTRDNKQQMINVVYMALMDARIILSDRLATCSKHDVDKRVQKTSIQETVELLGEQMCRMRDQDDGTISGKTAGGDGDDLCMALMMGMYWAAAIRASEAAAGKNGR